LLAPGDFGVVEVLEELKLSTSHVGRFGLRSKYARKGLIATTGTQIDPGFHGILIIGITNLTPKPITLPYKDDFVSVEFHKLEKPSSKAYDGPYQSKMGIGPEEIESIMESEGMALSEMLNTLRALNSSVSVLSSDFKSIKWTFIALVGVLTLIAAWIAVFK